MKVGDLVTVKFDDKGWHIPDNTDSMLWVLLEIAPSNEWRKRLSEQTSEVLVCSPKTGYKCWTRQRWVKVVE